MAVQSSPFFDKLPAELRNNIYELVFTPNTIHITNGEQVELSKAAPPTKALLLTCKEAYSEAKGLYKIAYRHYWQAANFYVSHDLWKPATALKVYTAQQSPTDINHITHLTVRFREPSHSSDWVMIDRRDSWQNTALKGIEYNGAVVRKKDDGGLVLETFIDEERTKEVLETGGQTPSIMEQLHVWLLF